LVDFTRDLRVDNRLTVAPEVHVPDPTKLVGAYVYVTNDGARNAVYPIRDARRDAAGQLVLEIGDVTTIRGYVDKEDFTKGYRYDVAVGAAVRIPLTRQWSAR
jgi:oligo-alginate lyase